MGTGAGLGPLIVAIDGPSLLAEERELLRHPAVGGVILFARNYTDREQLCALTAAIRALRDPPLLLLVDQEGGRVQRFRDGFTRLPPPGTIGALYTAQPDRAEALAAQCGHVMAAELRACGVDLSCAPVLDLDRGVSSVIGDRALHSEPHAVARLAMAWVRGMAKGGMAAVGKHFPGHGAIAADSHVALPCDTRSLAQIAASDLLPFQCAIAAGLPAVMVAHIVFPEIDDRPAGFSRRWISDILRRRIGFSGAVLSDDLGMAGAVSVGSLSARCVQALAAGCDAVLLCQRSEAEAVLGDGSGSLELPTPADSPLRLARLYGRRAEAPPAHEWSDDWTVGDSPWESAIWD
ncbi:beta-N-acetylhexosaminidase [Halorhodospira abdelmalekii]|nr:beta-N-acetylhexosaminidase [Halorhodospira abdelmalekii]